MSDRVVRGGSWLQRLWPSINAPTYMPAWRVRTVGVRWAA